MEEQTHINFGLALLAIHHCVTRGLETARRHSLAFAEGDSPDKPAPQGLVDYVSSLATVLHGHHLVEDELVFPYIRERLPGAPYDALSGQHLQMDPLLEEIRSQAGRAGAAPGLAEPWQRIGLALAALMEIWHPHIGVEETNFTPAVVEECFSHEEQDRLLGEVGRLNQQHLVPPELTVAFTLYNLEPGDRAVLAAAMPPVLWQQLVPVVWRAQWEPMVPYLLP
jgi:hypothetical protein